MIIDIYLYFLQWSCYRVYFYKPRKNCHKVHVIHSLLNSISLSVVAILISYSKTLSVE